MKKLTELLKRYPQFQMLDIGTGVGNFIMTVQQLTDDYQKIVGIDYSERMIELARKNFAEDKRIEFTLMDVNDSLFDDETFDIVSLSNSLHHLSDIKKTLEEMRRLVKPEGVILIHEMISDGLNDKQMSHKLLHHFSAEIDRELGLMHNDTYTRDEIIHIFNEHSNLTIDSFLPVIPETLESATDEEVEGILQLVDRLVSRAKDSDKIDYFTSKAEEIKKYIREHSYEGCTQMIYVLKK